MTRINGLVFVVVGVTVSLVSLNVGPSFIFFFWCGVGFVIYGGLKLTFRYVKLKGEQEAASFARTSHPARLGRSHASNRCPRCGARIFPSFIFCAKCGYKLR